MTNKQFLWVIYLTGYVASFLLLMTLIYSHHGQIAVFDVFMGLLISLTSWYSAIISGVYLLSDFLTEIDFFSIILIGG